jgi:hypothetical protein
MKKLVLIAVWASILTVFLAFNYLLWERENPKTDSTVKNPVNDSVAELNAAIKRLEDSNIKLQKENNLLTTYNTQYQEDIRLKNILIYKLKERTDLTFLEDIVKLWVKSVNDKDYKTAFRLFSNDMIYHKEYSVRMSDYFKSYDIVKSIKVNSVKLDLENVLNGKNGKIVLDVLLDVKLRDSQRQSPFKEGLNTRYFTMIYDDITEDWYISAITDKP